MRALFTAAFAISVLAGCATSPAPASYGNFVQAAAAADSRAMADDVASKLAAIYPPARTRFALQQETPDAFGISLVAQLRKRGYAVAEFRKTAIAAAPPKASSSRGGEPMTFALAYIVDQPLEEPLYRITVVVDMQNLSRLYRLNYGRLVPAGYWIRKE